MVIQSSYEPLDIPKCNILDFLFPDPNPSTEPLWINAEDPTHYLSPASMLLWIKRFAQGLDNLSLPQDRAIMVFTPNHLFVPMAYLAAAGSGRYFTGANPSYTSSELAFQIKTIDAAILLAHPTLLSTALAAAKQANLPSDRIYSFSDRPSPSPTNTTPKIKDWQTLLAPISTATSWTWPTFPSTQSTTQIAAINFSSGTTGLPKGVFITHHNLIANALQSAHVKYASTPYSPTSPAQERWLAFLPLYHAYSQLWTINIACLLQSIPVYIMRSFDFPKFLGYIQQYKITHIQAVPPVLVMLSKRPETKSFDISSLKHMVCGAAPLGYDLQNEVSKRFGLVISQGWGMTECTCVGMMMEGMVNDLTGCVGGLLPNTAAKLVGEDGLEVEGEGKEGELWIKGPQVMRGYWRNKQATKGSLRDGGWLVTGDVAVEKKGRFWIVDRKKELIKVKGLQVAPAELEAVLLEDENVADAAVTGIMVNGEEWPRAYVVLQESARGRVKEEDIKEFVKGKVARHKWLVGGVKFVEGVPKLASGKIVRKVMREWAKRDAKEVEEAMKAKL